MFFFALKENLLTSLLSMRSMEINNDKWIVVSSPFKKVKYLMCKIIETIKNSVYFKISKTMSFRLMTNYSCLMRRSVLVMLLPLLYWKKFSSLFLYPNQVAWTIYLLFITAHLNVSSKPLRGTWFICFLYVRVARTLKTIPFPVFVKKGFSFNKIFCYPWNLDIKMGTVIKLILKGHIRYLLLFNIEAVTFGWIQHKYQCTSSHLPTPYKLYHLYSLEPQSSTRE